MVENRVLAGRYRLLEPLGRGGMAQVWSGQDLRLGRPVALKLVDLGAAAPTAGARFRREARVTARLAHPNIVSVYDTGVDQATAFLVMELLRGPTVQARLASDGRLSIGEVVRVGTQVAAALTAAHHAGVVHRDLKPSNVAYVNDRQVKVLDFGIARLIESTTDRTRLTQTNTVLGTAAYLSPEQASGAPADGRSDLYALGCLLFALAAGEPPFVGESPLAICAQHVNAPTPSLSDRRPDAPAGLAALVADLLRKKPTDRPADAAAVHDRLVALEAGPSQPSSAELTQRLDSTGTRTEVLERPAGAVARSRAWPHPRLIAGGAVMAVIVVIALLLALPGGSSPHRSTAGTRPAATTRPAPATSTLPPSTTTPAPSTIAPGTSVPTSPIAGITNFSQAVSRAEAAGDITPSAGRDLLNRSTDLLSTAESGHLTDASHKVADLVHHLGDLTKSGQVTAAGQQILTGPLTALEQVLPLQSGGPGPPPAKKAH